MRAERLALSNAPIEIAAETNVEDIVATLSGSEAPALVVIDSIQTMWTETVESAPGTGFPLARHHVATDTGRRLREFPRANGAYRDGKFEVNYEY